MSRTPKRAHATDTQPDTRVYIMDKLAEPDRKFLKELLSDAAEELAHTSGSLNPCRDCGENIDCSTCPACSDSSPTNYDAEFQRSDCAHLRAIESVMERIGSIQ